VALGSVSASVSAGLDRLDEEEFLFTWVEFPSPVSKHCSLEYLIRGAGADAWSLEIQSPGAVVQFFHTVA
jgi:hypothetical protein